MKRRELVGSLVVFTPMAWLPPRAIAGGRYDAGATDATIRVGQTLPYSGPASAYGQFGRAEAAYFKMINEKGGVNGRKIEFDSLDDAYSPPKTVELTRRLVEQDEVLLMFGSLGTATNSAVHKYLNDRRVPQLFVFSGAAKWNDPKNFPWTMGLQPSYPAEARVYAQHILNTRPSARIAVFSQNDDFGKDYLKGLREGLGDKGNLIIAEQTYEPSDPTVDSQIVALKASGAEVLMNIATPKFAAQAIRKVAEVGWKPQQYLTLVSSSIGAVLMPAGLENAVGVITASYIKDATDKAWDDDGEMNTWREFMKKYLPEADPRDSSNVSGYAAAQLLVYVLQQCGDDLTRENVMRHAADIKDFQPTLYLPGVKINTSPDEYAPVRSMQLSRFDGKSWVRFGAVLEGR